MDWHLTDDRAATERNKAVNESARRGAPGLSRSYKQILHFQLLTHIVMSRLYGSRDYMQTAPRILTAQHLRPHLVVE